MGYLNYGYTTAWKIIYSDFSGVERRAVELLSRELGERVNRDAGIYSLHVLPCEKESENTEIGINAVVVGTYGESALIRKFVTEEENNSHAYIIKVVNNPDFEGGSIACVTSDNPAMLYRAAAKFIDDYTEEYAPLHGGMRLSCEMFKKELPEATLYGEESFEARSIFAWGHAINDYRSFISDMARQGLNQLILWNDFAPLNAHDIVEYAHSFGIEIIWGYAWGWSENACSKTTDLSKEALARLKAEVLKQYDEIWQGLGDGIYFQSFTEMRKDNIGGVNIAEAVTDFVNEVAEELYKRDPRLHLQFGLHATSVKDHADAIARVDKRIEILWEDCGAFPYAYVPAPSSEEEFESAFDFTERIINLRPGAPVGLVFKGFATLDWTNGHFVHQRGRFILGENTPGLMENDRHLRADAWRAFSAGWARYGEYARRMIEYVHKLTGGRCNVCMAGLFDGGIWLPEAICTDIFENPYEDFSKILERTMGRRNVK